MTPRAAGFSKKAEVVKGAFASVSASDVIRAPAGPHVVAPDDSVNRQAMDWGDLAQLRRLQDELAQTQRTLVFRESELAEAQRQAASTQTSLLKAEADLARTQAASKASLNEKLQSSASQLALEIDKARNAWQAEHDARVADLETQMERRAAAAEAAWREQSDRVLADAAARRADAVSQAAKSEIALERSQAELSRRREELAAAQTALAARDAELARQQTDGEQARQRSQQDREASLSHARTAWKAEEAVRLTVAQTRWREQSDAALAQAMARAEAAELAVGRIRADAGSLADESHNELGRLQGEFSRQREELTAAQTALAARDTELARQRADGELARRQRQDSDLSLADARAAWKAEEEARLVAAQTRWRQESDAALAQATARCEAAELALAKVRSEKIAPARPSDDTYVDRLRAELTALQGVLVGRETELAHARSAIEQLRLGYWPEANAQQNRGWVEGGPEEQSVRRANQRLVRDVIVVVSLVMSLILFYPRMVSFMPDAWRANIAGMTGWFGLEADNSPAPAAPADPPPAPVAAKQETATVIRGVNVRNAPSTAAAIVSTLPRDAEVAVIERRGNWTLVEISAPGGKRQQGWAFSTYLKSRSGEQIPTVENALPR